MKCDKLFKEAFENIISVDSSQAVNSQKLPGKLGKLGKLEDIPVDILRQMLDIANEKDPNGTLGKAIKAEIHKRPLTMPAKPFDYDTIEPIVPGAGSVDIMLKGIPSAEIRGHILELESYKPTKYNQELIRTAREELKARDKAAIERYKDIAKYETSVEPIADNVINYLTNMKTSTEGLSNTIKTIRGLKEDRVEQLKILDKALSIKIKADKFQVNNVNHITKVEAILSLSELKAASTISKYYETAYTNARNIAISDNSNLVKLIPTEDKALYKKLTNMSINELSKADIEIIKSLENRVITKLKLEELSKQELQRVETLVSGSASSRQVIDYFNSLE